MPNVLIVNDNASFASSDTFSTRDSTEQPRGQLRRRSTVVQLTRKVSKRLSQSILRGATHEHELSERNLRGLDSVASHSPQVPNRQNYERKLHNPIYEDTEEECPAIDVEAVREMRLQESYAVFCQNFTLSATPRISRRFDLTMGMEKPGEFSHPSPTHPIPEPSQASELSGPDFSSNHTTVDARPRPNAVGFPISCPNTPAPQTTTAETSSEWPDPAMHPVKENFHMMSSSSDTTRSSNYPQPPHRIMTPAVWMDMQREERDRKAARRQRFLNPFRSWLVTSRPSLGRRYEVVE